MKLNFKDVTFIIPYFRDTKEREQNLLFILGFLHKHFDTSIIVLEGGKEPTFEQLNPPFVRYRWLPHDIAFAPGNLDIFYRTRVLNEGIKMANTKYISPYDTDVFFDVKQYAQALLLLGEGHPMVYPYDGEWIEIERTYLTDGCIIRKNSFGVGSFGGAFFADRKIYMECGMENENFIGWGAEDLERKTRMEYLGYPIVRAEGPLYHIWHPRGPNSSTHNPYWKQNESEMQRIRLMNKGELLDFIKTWEWATSQK